MQIYYLTVLWVGTDFSGSSSFFASGLRNLKLKCQLTGLIGKFWKESTPCPLAESCGCRTEVPFPCCLMAGGILSYERSLSSPCTWAPTP